MTTTPNLAMKLVLQQQAQKEVTVNEALIRLDALLNTGVIERGLDTPPEFFTLGGLYIIGTSPTDAWADHANEVTYFEQEWRFILPKEGLTLWVCNEDKLYTWDGSAWGTSSAATALGDLSDVTLTSVTEHDILQYNGSVFVNTDTLTATTLQSYTEVVEENATASGTITIDFTNGNIHQLTLTGTVTSLNFTAGPAAGIAGNLVIILIQDSSGGHTISWPASVKWPDGIAPGLSTAPNAVDVVTLFTVDGGTTYYATATKNFN